MGVVFVSKHVFSSFKHGITITITRLLLGKKETIEIQNDLSTYL